ncbi:hypothetical protein JCM6882_007800 [Rhodosporidiobolus microsporus]
MADLWLKANYPLGPFPTPPIDQAVADVLAKSPYAAWQTGRVAFTYEFVDRPEAGTALLALVNPPTRQTPSDGLRYMYAEPNEVRSVTTHTVSVPASFANPGQSRKEEVQLECLTSMAGHFPPVSPAQPLTPDSPEMRLTRFRKRWRITNGQYPGLWFYWWGRDDSGGLGGAPAPMAPAGWERNAVRAYPLVKPPNFPSAPLFPFPDQSRVAAGQTGPGVPPAGPPATPQQAQQLGGAAGTPAANPYARQQQLAALASHTPLGMSASNPTLEARQQQFQAQQAAMMAAQQQGRVPGGPGAPGAYPPYGLTPQQMQQAQQMQAHQAQMLAAQQQQQQQQAAAAQAQAAAAQAAAAAAAAATRNQRKPPVVPSASSSAVAAAAPNPSAAGPNIAAAVPPQHEDETPLTDIFDVLTPRQLATHRYAKNHDLLAPLFDAWDASSILSGQPRAREIDELVATNGISARLGEPRVGVVPGLGREGALGVLGTSAARVAVYGALGKRPEKATMGMEVGERRERLERMLRELEGQVEGLEKKNGEQLEKLRRATSGEGAAVAA